MAVWSPSRKALPVTEIGRRSVSPQYYTDLIYSSLLRYDHSARGVKILQELLKNERPVVSSCWVGWLLPTCQPTERSMTFAVAAQWLETMMKHKSIVSRKHVIKAEVTKLKSPRPRLLGQNQWSKHDWKDRGRLLPLLFPPSLLFPTSFFLLSPHFTKNQLNKAAGLEECCKLPLQKMNLVHLDWEISHPVALILLFSSRAINHTFLTFKLYTLFSSQHKTYMNVLWSIDWTWQLKQLT